MRPSHPLRTVIAVLTALTLLAACGDGAGEQSVEETPGVEDETGTNTTDEGKVTETDTSVVISVTGLSFPAEVTVPAGKSVNWVNDSSAPHEVQMDTRDGSPADIDPVRLGTGEEGGFSLEAGTWTYFCTIHSSMTGTLVVEA